MNIPFYNQYFKIPTFQEDNQSNVFKHEYICSLLKNGKLYKFVAFTDDYELNLRKIDMLKNEEF